MAAQRVSETSLLASAHTRTIACGLWHRCKVACHATSPEGCRKLQLAGATPLRLDTLAGRRPLTMQ